MSNAAQSRLMMVVIVGLIAAILFGGKIYLIDPQMKKDQERIMKAQQEGEQIGKRLVEIVREREAKEATEQN